MEVARARRETDNTAGNQRRMEQVWEREKRRAALKRVRANQMRFQLLRQMRFQLLRQGSPGIDGMTVDELPEYLEQHWPALREQLLSGTYAPKPVFRGEIDKPDGGARNQGI